MAVRTWSGRSTRSTTALNPGAIGEDLTLLSTLDVAALASFSAGINVTGTTTSDDVDVTDDLTVGDDAIIEGGLTVGSTDAPLNGQFKFGVAGGAGYLTAYAGGAYIPGHLDGTELFFEISGVEKAKLETTGNMRFKAAATLAHIATPSAPASGYTHIYGKSDGRLYQQVPAGVEDQIAIVREQLRSVNILVNGGFEPGWGWQRNTTFSGLTTGLYSADMWHTVRGGSSTINVAQETTIKSVDSEASMKITYTHNAASTIQQRIEADRQYRGRTVTLAADLYSTTANSVRIGIVDSASGSYTSYHAGNSAFARVSVTHTVSASSTDLVVAIYMNATGVFYIDNVTLTIGTVAAEWNPAHAADEATRCYRYYEQIGGYGQYQSFAVMQARTATGADGVLNFFRKAAVPSITFSSPASQFALQNGGLVTTSTAMQVFYISPYNANLNCGVAAGLTPNYCYVCCANNSLSPRIYIEANA